MKKNYFKIRSERKITIEHVVKYNENTFIHGSEGPIRCESKKNPNDIFGRITRESESDNEWIYWIERIEIKKVKA